MIPQASEMLEKRVCVNYKEELINVEVYEKIFFQVKDSLQLILTSIYNHIISCYTLGFIDFMLFVPFTHFC